MTDLEIQEQAEKILQEYKGDGVYIHEDDAIGAMNDLAKLMQEQGEWISVEDRLPYKDGDSSIYCLVFATGYDIIVRPYNEYHKCWDDEDGDDHFTKDVGGLITHWQPLPSPPKTK